MRRSYAIIMKLLRLVGLVVLALNIMIVSIPRCEMIFTVLQDDLPHQSCHDTAKPVDTKAMRWTSDRYCECSLLHFMAFPLPKMEIQSYVVFRVQTERLLTFDWQDSSADFLPMIDPPYPKV